MRVSSPIGDLPFEPTALKLAEGKLQMHGQMGAWPAQVTFEVSDLPSFAKVVAKPVLCGAGAVLAVLGATQLSRTINRTTEKGALS